MTHPIRFMQSILADPADDAPRFAYANWLDACGNPLGEFIRLQCALAGGQQDGTLLHQERREQELLARHGTAWSQALAGCVEWASFRRGFIEEVSLTDRQLLRNANELFFRAPVVDLHLKTEGRRLENLPEVRNLRHTIFLDVSSQALGNAGIACLARAPMLRHVHGLNLGSNHLGDDGLEALIDAPHLGAIRELYLNDNPLTDAGVRLLAMSPFVECLRLLDMRFTHISHESADFLRHIMDGRVVL